jgi:hypothetical protein
MPDASSSGADGDEEQFDLPPPIDMSCQKIDFLFVIDNSGSMQDEQERLIDGFPGFIEQIEASIQQYDYHLMVVTTGSPFGSDTDPAACDGALGVGRIEDWRGTDCGLAPQPGDSRYADTEDGELAEVFACVASVGTYGSGTEQPIWAMGQALIEHSRPGGCNEGFLRDDAILVVTMITDEEDADDSPGDPAVWKDVLVSAKYGDEDAVVMLGLLGDPDLDDGVCEPYDLVAGGDGAEPAPRLRRFVESFPFGSWSSVCADDYAPFFNEAVADIGEACRDFTPPG